MGMSNLDWSQCIKSSYIDESNMLRTGTPVALEVNVLEGAVTGSITESVTDCDGVRNLNIHALAGSANLSTAAVATVQFSPSDTDNIWIDTSVSATSATAAGGITSGTAISNLLARRIRVKLNVAPSGGDASFYIIGC